MKTVRDREFTPINSMSDVQRQARYGWDKEPWVGWKGERTPGFDVVHWSEYAPRPSCIPSPDCAYCAGWGFVWGNGRTDEGERDRCPHCEGTGKRVRTEANPILAAFRDDHEQRPKIQDWIDALAPDATITPFCPVPSATTEQVAKIERFNADARRVLTKLRDVMEAGKR